MPIDEQITLPKYKFNLNVDGVPYTVWVPLDSPLLSADAQESVATYNHITEEIRATRIHFFNQWTLEPPDVTFH